MELYELRDSDEPVMSHADDDQHVKLRIRELINYFEEPLNSKKINRCLNVPWAKSSGILLGGQAQITIINSLDNASYGETLIQSRRSCCWPPNVSRYRFSPTNSS